MDELEEIFAALAGEYLDPTGALDSTAAIQERLDRGEKIPDGVYKVAYHTLKFRGAAARDNPVRQVWFPQGSRAQWIRFGQDPGVTTIHLVED